jgi:hypothetical protein
VHASILPERGVEVINLNSVRLVWLDPEQELAA